LNFGKIIGGGPSQIRPAATSACHCSPVLVPSPLDPADSLDATPPFKPGMNLVRHTGPWSVGRTGGRITPGDCASAKGLRGN